MRVVSLRVDEMGDESRSSPAVPGDDASEEPNRSRDARGGDCPDDRADVPVHRRGYMRAVAGVSLLPFAGVDPDRTHDIVDDLGAEPGDAVDDLLQRAMAAGMTVRLPAGRYLLRETVHVRDDHAGIVGAGSDRTVLELDRSDGPAAAVRVDGRSTFRMEGLTVRGANGRTPELHLDVADRLALRDVRVAGGSDPHAHRLSVAAGRRRTAGARDRTLVVRGTGAASTYSATVDGEITPDGADTSAGDLLGPGAEGTVTDGADRYRFDGAVTHFALDGPAEIYLDGRRVDPAVLGTDVAGRLPGRLVVDGRGATLACEFLADGPVARRVPLGAFGAPVRTADVAVTHRAVGDVATFQFAGDLLVRTAAGRVRSSGDSGS
jgi:hypothetical protein